MNSFNQVQLIGNLGKDPETRTKEADRPVVVFSVATSERWTDRGGAKQEVTDWHNVVVFGKLAEVCAKHLKKGAHVQVVGKLRVRKYEKDGENRTSTSIHASQINFLSPLPRAEDVPNDATPAAEDDLPF